VPCYHDVRELTAQRLAADGIVPDVITGGFPCQDISLAGDGAGLDGERSGLWREFARLVREVRPRFLFVENVAALAGRGLDRVLADLAACGFDAEWDTLPTGLPFGHRRERLFLVAYDVRAGLPQWSSTNEDRAHAPLVFTRERFASLFEVAIPAEKWADRPLLGRGISRVPERVDRVTACGNTIVPLVPEMIGRAVLQLSN
jgi:DNA (cytosine-5)-methyltransferase 1